MKQFAKDHGGLISRMYAIVWYNTIKTTRVYILWGMLYITQNGRTQQCNAGCDTMLQNQQCDFNTGIDDLTAGVKTGLNRLIVSSHYDVLRG